MRRSLVTVLLLAIAFPALEWAQPKAKKKQPCQPTLAACPDEGCGSNFDPNLNRLKNIRSDDRPATVRSLTWMKKLDDPESFTQGDSREELAELGEGQKIRVAAYLRVAKREGAESCNCGLDSPKDTDNHLVLVTKKTVDKFPITNDPNTNKKIFHSRELESVTAEFTPRVRLTHPRFTREDVQPLINKTQQKALLVRVTGLLMFDSEHFIKHHLVRVNNWEIHPVLELEFCTLGDKCKVSNDAGWKALDDLS